MSDLDLLYQEGRSAEDGLHLDLVFGQLAPPPDGGGSGGGGSTGPALEMTVRSRWGARGAAASQAVRTPWAARSDGLGAGVRARWGVTNQRAAVVRAPWRNTARVGQAIRAPWSGTEAASTAVRSGWSAALRVHPASWRAPWQRGTPVAVYRRLDWADGSPVSRTLQAPWDMGAPTAVQVRASAADGESTVSALVARWQGGTPVVSWGGPWVPVAGPSSEIESCRSDDPATDLQLLFEIGSVPASEPTVLLFACRRPAVVVLPIRRVYVVARNVTLVRVSDDVPVPCVELSLSIDVDSWSWSFSATVPAAAESLVQPSAGGVPTLLDATVNGATIRVLVDSIQRERTWPRRSLRIGGRSQSALLADPFAAAALFGNASSLEAQQLADQAMPSGWTVDWQIDSWLVPAGLWSHRGTPMSAALAIAAAGGAYVQPHETAQEIRILPRYRIAPWDWAAATPDLSLPAAAVQVERMQWVDKPAFNRVYVAGTGPGGVLGRITRASTAGDLEAPMVVDPLISTIGAARQRALPVLADTGRIAMVDLTLQVHPETGIVMPGTLLSYVEDVTRLGLVRAVSVNSNESRVRQTISVETRA